VCGRFNGDEAAFDDVSTDAILDAIAKRILERGL
jgi:hypothetical protein